MKWLKMVKGKATFVFGFDTVGFSYWASALGLSKPVSRPVSEASLFPISKMSQAPTRISYTFLHHVGYYFPLEDNS